MEKSMKTDVMRQELLVRATIMFVSVRDGRYFDDIFEISKEFYDFAVETKLENITKKMYILFNRM
jgi:hypothetical protein